MKTADLIKGTDALRQGIMFLTKAGQDKQTACLEARMLLGKAWGKKGINLIVTLNNTLDSSIWSEYLNMLERRANYEPLQYILGEQEFMDLTFKVRPGVLIPRWETELLVKESLQSANNFHRPRILDIGTGSGAIAVSLAYYHKQAQLVAVDVSALALEQASANAQQHGVKEKISFVKSDLFSALTSNNKFHIIISNPPYISSDEYDNLPLDVKKEPYLALYGGKDGLDYYRRIATEAKQYLFNGGFLLFEIGWMQADAVSEILQKNSFIGIKIIRDLSGKDRVITAKISGSV